MLKFIMIVLVGVTIGYFLGFEDAQKYSENVFTRVVHRVGGDSRGRVGNDTDRQMDSLEKR